MIYPELLLVSVVSACLDGIARDPSLIPDTLSSLLTPDAADWITRSLASVPVVQGFPQTTQQEAIIALTIGPENEDPRQVIGSYVGDEQILGTGTTETGEGAVIGTRERRTGLFSGQYRFTVYSINATRGTLLARLVQYALLSERGTLNDCGLEEQKISMSDMRPASDGLPDFPFARTVALTCLYEQQYVTSIIDPQSILTQIAVTFTELTTTVTV